MMTLEEITPSDIKLEIYPSLKDFKDKKSMQDKQNQFQISDNGSETYKWQSSYKGPGHKH